MYQKRSQRSGGVLKKVRRSTCGSMEIEEKHTKNSKKV